MDLPIYSRESASVRQFITFWADQYPRKEMEQDDKGYTPHITKPLTRESLETLYEWKNQTPLSKKKTLSVSENYIAHLDLLQKLPRQTAPKCFLETFSKGGAIWRIFLLHCWSRAEYPIYDQNVHRAMAFIRTGDPHQEIASWTDAKKISAYLDQYIPFFQSFGRHDPRQVDRALTVLGRFLAQFVLASDGSNAPRLPVA